MGRRAVVARIAAAALVVLAAGLVAVAPSGRALADDFVLVRNAKNPTASASRSEIKDMVIGKKKTWSSGAPVQLVIGPQGSPEVGWLASAVVGVSEGALLTKIKQEVFKGELRKPVTAASEKDCLAAVGADPGAFGVVSAAAAKALPSNVAILTAQ